jgi:hypothetical protein
VQQLLEVGEGDRLRDVVIEAGVEAPMPTLAIGNGWLVTAICKKSRASQTRAYCTATIHQSRLCDLGRRIQ